eukprot:sb/3468902/
MRSRVEGQLAMCHISPSGLCSQPAWPLVLHKLNLASESAGKRWDGVDELGREVVFKEPKLDWVLGTDFQITVYIRFISPQQQEPTRPSKQPMRTRYLGHVTGYQPIRDQYFLHHTHIDSDKSAGLYLDTMLSLLIHQSRRSIPSRTCMGGGFIIDQELTETSKQPIRTRQLGHVTGYQPIRDQSLVFPDWVGSCLIYILRKILQLYTINHSNFGRFWLNYGVQERFLNTLQVVQHNTIHYHTVG